jgi:hypothetical protein
MRPRAAAAFDVTAVVSAGADETPAQDEEQQRRLAPT